jgi:hypothetical protein
MVLMVGNVIMEHSQRRPHEPGDAVWMSTGSASLD